MYIRPVFDLKEREDIRVRLLAYKVRHGIGTPTIAKRIEAAAPDGAPIYHKTLSRFLARKHQPQDAFISRCVIFLNANPEPVADPDGDLARSMIGFFGVHPGREFAGAYTLLPDPAPTQSPFEMTITADDGFWRLTEHFSVGRTFFEGVLVNTPFSAIATLTERLSGSIKTLHIQPESDTIIRCYETVAQSGGYLNLRFSMERQP